MTVDTQSEMSGTFRQQGVLFDGGKDVGGRESQLVWEGRKVGSLRVVSEDPSLERSLTSPKDYPSLCLSNRQRKPWTGTFRYSF